MQHEKENELDPENYDLESLESSDNKETDEETEESLSDAEETLPDANKFVDEEE